MHKHKPSCVIFNNSSFPWDTLSNTCSDIRLQVAPESMMTSTSSSSIIRGKVFDSPSEALKRHGIHRLHLRCFLPRYFVQAARLSSVRRLVFFPISLYVYHLFPCLVYPVSYDNRPPCAYDFHICCRYVYGKLRNLSPCDPA